MENSTARRLADYVLKGPNRASQGAVLISSLSSAPKPKLLDRVRDAIRTRHYSYRTEKAYVHWIKRFIFFHNKRHPIEMGEPEVARFLSSLASDGHVSASTQNQAFNALLFLYKEVLGKKIGRGRARKESAETAGRAHERRSQESDRSHERFATFDGVSPLRRWIAADGVLSSPGQRYRLFTQRDRRSSRQR